MAMQRRVRPIILLMWFSTSCQQKQHKKNSLLSFNTDLGFHGIGMVLLEGLREMVLIFHLIFWRCLVKSSQIGNF